jgi:hypothetical protein
MIARVMVRVLSWAVGTPPQAGRAVGLVTGNGLDQTGPIFVSVKRNDHQRRSNAEDEADARRIVACVNFCAGVDREALEKGPGLDAMLRERQSGEDRPDWEPLPLDPRNLSEEP